MTDIKDSYNRLVINIRDYLIERFPDCPRAIIDGMVTGILHQIIPFTNDIVKTRDKIWEDRINERLGFKIKEKEND